jgi:hypothetical protein
MAIDNTTNICFDRECTNRAVKHTISDTKPANHDNLEKSTSFAIKQLGVIKYYMSDYVEIIKGCKEEKKENNEVGKEVTVYLNGLNDRNELI